MIMKTKDETNIVTRGLKKKEKKGIIMDMEIAERWLWMEKSMTAILQYINILYNVRGHEISINIGSDCL